MTGQSRANIPKKVFEKLKKYGVKKTLGICLKNVLYYMYWLSGFDRKFGTDTEGLIPLGELNVTGDINNLYYRGTYVGVFHKIMKNLPIADYKDFIFVDFGAGKGRAILIGLRLSI